MENFFILARCIASACMKGSSKAGSKYCKDASPPFEQYLEDLIMLEKNVARDENDLINVAERWAKQPAGPILS